jgi:hypothetical protein
LPGLLDNLIERILDNSHGAVLDQLGNQITYLPLIDDAFYGKPLDAFEVGGRVKSGDRRRGDAGNKLDDLLQIGFRHV